MNVLARISHGFLTPWSGMVPPAATDSLRQQIMTALAARLATIQIANGYQTDLGLHIFDHKAEPWAEEDLPGGNLEDTDVPEQWIGLELHRLNVQFLGIISGGTPSENLRAIHGDVITAIGVDRTFGGLCEETSAVTADPAQVKIGENVFTGALVRFTIEYTTGNMNAYTN